MVTPQGTIFDGVPMSSSPGELEQYGRELVATGKLQQLREHLGLSRNAMADLLHTSLRTYTSWEQRSGDVTVRPATAGRIARFYVAAARGIGLLGEAGYNVKDLMPFHLVATHLGIPQELLLRRYREGQIEAIDAGILGLWIRRESLEYLQ